MMGVMVKKKGQMFDEFVKWGCNAGKLESLAVNFFFNIPKKTFSK